MIIKDVISELENLNTNRSENLAPTEDGVEVVDGVQLLQEEEEVCEIIRTTLHNDETQHMKNADMFIEEVNEEDIVMNEEEEEEIIIAENNIHSVLHEVEGRNSEKVHRTTPTEELPEVYDDPLYYSNGKRFQMKTIVKKISKAEYGFRVFIQKLKACICPADRH